MLFSTYRFAATFSAALTARLDLWSSVVSAELSLQLVQRERLDFQVENQPRAAYIGKTALVCVEECVHSVMFLKKQLQA